MLANIPFFFVTLKITPHQPTLPFVPVKGLTVLVVFFVFFFFLFATHKHVRVHKHSLHTKDKCSYADELSGSGLTQTQAITMAAADDVKVFLGLLCMHVGSRLLCFFDSLGRRHAVQRRASLVPT